jgi:DNA-binding CsgD family transcriptional regulator
MGNPGPVERWLGRTVELVRLHALLDEAMTGQPRVVLCSGEPGIGKTSLLRRFADAAGRRGAHVVWSPAFGAPGAPPYWIWRHLKSPSETYADGGQPVDRAVLSEHLGGRLHDLGEDSGVVLVLDDLDRADESSLEVLLDVVRTLRSGRALVCGAHTDGTDHTSEWPRIRQALLAELTAEALPLTGLTRKQVSILIASVTEDGLPGSADIFEVTHGNPLFVRELAREVSEKPAPARLPRSLDDLIASRLAELSTSGRRLLDAAAVLGNHVRIPVLARVLDLEPADCLEVIDEAVRAGFLCMSDSAGRTVFAHEVVRSAVTSRLSLSDQANLHRRAARAVEETTSGNLGDHLNELAHHWSLAGAAGASGEACEWARRAADEAMRVLAFGEAERLYLLALENAGALDAVARGRLLLLQAAASAGCGHLPGARESCREALNIAHRVGSPNLLASVALTLEPIGDPTWDGDIYGWCTEALASPTDNATRVRLLARQTQAAVYCGLGKEALYTSAEAVRQAEDLADPTLTVEALTARQLASSGPDDVDELTQLADRMITIGTSTGRPDVEMWGRLWRIDAHWYTGSLAAIATETARLQRCTDRIGGPYARWHLLVTRAALARARAEFDDAERLGSEAIDLFQRIGHPAAHGASVVFRLLLGHHRGYTGDILSASAWDFGTDPRWDQFSRLGRAFALAESGHRDQAAALYDRCGAPEGWVIPRGQLLVGLALGAQVAAALDIPSDVTLLRDRLTPYRGRYVVGGGGATVFLGPVELTLGKCAAALGLWQEAREELTRASGLCREVGAPGFRTEADCVLAATLVCAGEQAEARRVGERTLSLARALGMPPWVRRLEAVLEGAKVDPLSQREREVAALVAEGLSNRAIAEKLVISERTAQNHVQHILGKLSFASRAQIAAWASRELKR